jgi:hypothetical protein
MIEQLTKQGNRCYYENHYYRYYEPNKLWIYSGTFNPLHSAHLEIFFHAKRKIGEKDYLSFETPLKPFDKEEKERKLEAVVQQFNNLCLPLIVSDFSSFIEKRKRLGGLNGCNFVVGDDTFKRIFDISYYHNSKAAMENCLESLIGSKFLVYPRHMGQTEYNIVLDDFPYLRDNFTFVSDFAPENISSTQLREQSV